MEKNRWSLIFIGLCLALAFSVSSVEAQDPGLCFGGNFCDKDVDGYIRDHGRCTHCGGSGIDCNDNDNDPLNECSGGGDDGDTKTSKKSIDLILTFDDVPFDNVQSDMINSPLPSPYIDNEDRVGVSAAEHSQPNGAAGIHLGMSRKNGRGRQLLLDITCVGMDVDGDPDVDGPRDIDNCHLLPVELNGKFSGFFPNCEVGNNFCDFGAAVRPYKVDCPELLNGECPDVFTMGVMEELMSFRLGSPGLSIEVASNIGGDGSQDPGTCLSLLTESQRTYFLAHECDVNGSNCNVSVMASSDGMGENDEWDVQAIGVTALMCIRRTGIVLGKATLTFGFKAEKK